MCDIFINKELKEKRSLGPGHSCPHQNACNKAQKVWLYQKACLHTLFSSCALFMISFQFIDYVNAPQSCELSSKKLSNYVRKQKSVYHIKPNL